MTQDRVHPEYGHGLLVHHDDDELVAGTRTFVRQGLASGGNVVVRGPVDRVETMRQALGVHPRLTYGFDEDAYLAPTRALFAYQKSMAESPDPTAFWVTGPVPLGHDSAAQAAWARYESAVDEALCSYPYRALCTYDAQNSPASVIAAARATHSTISDGVTSHSNPEYVDPSAFLANPLAQVPEPTQVPAVGGHQHHAARRAGKGPSPAPRNRPQLKRRVAAVVPRLPRRRERGRRQRPRARGTAGAHQTLDRAGHPDMPGRRLRKRSARPADRLPPTPHVGLQRLVVGAAVCRRSADQQRTGGWLQRAPDQDGPGR